MRSYWKGIPLSNRLDRLYNRKKRLTAGHNHRRLFISDRALNLRKAPITEKMIGLVFQVNTGRDFLKLNINTNMLGYKLGGFVDTKNYTSYKAKKKKK